MRHVKTHPVAAPIEVPKDSKVSADPIEGGVCVVNAAVLPGEDGHEVWRTLTADERAERKQMAETASVQIHMSAMLTLRLKRDAMLRATDWIEANLANAPLLPQGEWAMWRQKLRDLPANVPDPESPIWPEPPAPISALLEWRSLWPGLEWSA